MELSPIAGIRLMAQPKAKPVDPELSALFDIEATAKPGDDTYTSNRRKAAGAEEADEESEEPQDIFDDDLPLELATARNDNRQDDGSEAGPQGQISFFA